MDRGGPEAQFPPPGADPGHVRSRAWTLGLLATVPVVALTLLVSLWATWYAGRDDRELRRTAQAALEGQVTTDALSGLSTEVTALAGLGALGADLPPELVPYAQSAAALPTPSIPLETLLLQGDGKGADVLRGLERAGVPIGPEARRAFAPLPPEDVDRAVRGEVIASATAADYAAAVRELQGRFAAAPARTQGALAGLIRLSARPPLWKDPAFVGTMAAIWVLAFVAAWLVAVRVSRTVRAAEAHAADLALRNQRLVSMVDATRRMSSANDLRGVAGAVAEEALGLLGAGAAAVYLLEEDALVPAGAAGAPDPAPVPYHAGLAGRVVESGSPARAVAASDPAFPGMTPVAAVAAPLVAGRRVIGAVVAARADERLPGDEDETALRMVAVAAGTAIEGARQFDSTAALARTDALTGLANRRSLDADLDGLAEAAAVGLVMVDVDHFKAFNDRHGHPAGDSLLRAVAAAVAGAVRSDDVVYRFGGEEFAVLLPGAGGEEAVAVAERIRSAVAGTPFPGGDSQPGGRVTVSVGVAVGAGREAAEVLGAADEALYRAKRSGRDRIAAGAGLSPGRSDGGS